MTPCGSKKKGPIRPYYLLLIYESLSLFFSFKCTLAAFLQVRLFQRNLVHKGRVEL